MGKRKRTKEQLAKIRITNKAYEARNRAAVRKMKRNYQNEKKERLRTLILELKSKPCLDCSSKFPYYVMEFDHVVGKKLFNINPARGSRYSWDYIMAEIAKCEVVCANCHRIRTHSRGQQDGTFNARSI